MEEEIFMQRREEEGRGKERRKALLEKEERKWKEIEASLMSSIPNAGNREAAALAAAVRAVGGDSVLDDSFARERVSSIARRIRASQLARRALQVMLSSSPSIQFLPIPLSLDGMYKPCIKFILLPSTQIVLVSLFG